MARAAQRPFEVRRGEVERARSVQGKDFEFTLFLDVQGSGEGLHETNFPVWFREIPATSSGGHLAENEVLQDDIFPTVSIVVKSWQTVERDGVTYYTGATLVLVALGRDEQKLTLHWTARGRALINPITDLTST